MDQKMATNLRKRQQSNGIQAETPDEQQVESKLDKQSELLAKKKLVLMEQDVTINNNNSGEVDQDETFCDIKTTADLIHSKLNTQDEQIFIFGKDKQPNKGNINNSIRDQFAASLLRLQANLDEQNSRLVDLEAKLDTIQRSRRQQGNKDKKSKGALGGLIGDITLGKLAYLSWPILVFVAMRAIERRSNSSVVKVA